MKKYVLHEAVPGSSALRIDYKGSLNSEQYEVVTKAEGPCLVLAGAGSGKTRTLIYRLAYLLEKGVRPENILLMTFTNKAAHEMRERAEDLLKYQPKGLWSGTFHHAGNKTLRMFAKDAGFGKDFGILDERDSEDLVKACMKGLDPAKKKDEFPKASVVHSVISFAANTEKKIEEVLDEKYPYFMKFREEIEKIAEHYRKKKKESNSMDYDDLLVRWKWLLENVPLVREKFTDEFRYIMVDEYQDTNLVQAEIVDILASTHRNLLVVGDDAQSIYSFRGARVDNILSFPKRFRDARIFKLETNYRSTPDILALANDSLSNNENQFPKDLKAVNAPKEKPILAEVRDLYHQASFVAQRVTEIREEEGCFKDTAVLFRAHFQSAELEMELVKRGIPYVIRGGVRFFEQAHIKDVLAYVKTAVNPMDELSWIRALTHFSGIGTGYAGKIFDSFKKSGLPLEKFLARDNSGMVPKKAQGGYSRFRKIMTVLLDPAFAEAPGEMVRSVLEGGYEMYALANFDNAKDRLDDIYELVNFSDRYATIQELLSDITLREGFKGEPVLGEEKEEDTLVLSTIHQAKGLEWNNVFVIGLCEGQFPHFKAMGGNDADIEEERRLFYVAVTRAKERLHLTYPLTRYDHTEGIVSTKRSRFLEELSGNDYEVWEVSGSVWNTDDEEDNDDDDDAGGEKVIEL